MALVETELQSHHIAVQITLNETLLQVLGDRVQLQQVILNLIDNAIEAMNAVSDDSRVLHLKTEPKDGENVRITVQDSGPEIDAENTERIFDRFFRPNLRVWEWVSPFVAPSSKLTVVVFGSRRDLTEVLFFDFFTG